MRIAFFLPPPLLAAGAGSLVGHAAPAAPGPPAGPPPLRSRVEPLKGSGEWHEVTLTREFVPAETALILCDVWDDHWCPSAARRCDALARRMAPVVDAARAAGVTVIHAPSECMDFYKDHPARKRTLAGPRARPPKPGA